MSREGKLIKNTLTYFVGAFGSKLLTFILLPMYARYLTKNSYGSYDLINTIISFAYPVLTLMLDNALYVYLIKTDNKKEKEHIISFAVQVLLCNCIIAITIFYLVNIYYPIPYMGWVLCWLISMSVYNVWIQICRGFNLSIIYSFSGILMSAVMLLGNIIGLVWLKLDYQSLIIVNCISFITSIVYLESKVHALPCFFKGKASLQLKKELLRYSLPLIPNSISWWVINVSDRLMLSHYIDTGANGIYAMASKIPSILIIIHTVFNLAWSDDILTSKSMKETEKYANAVYNKYIQMMIGVTLILICANRFIFEYIISGNFVEAYRYTFFLYLGSIFNALASCLGSFYGYYKKSMNMALSTCAAAGINLLINYLFIPVWGIQAASISTFVGFFAMWLFRLLGLKNIITIRVSNKNKGLFCLLIPLYFLYMVEGVWVNLIVIAGGVFVAALINREMVLQLFFKSMKIISGRLNRKRG